MIGSVDMESSSTGIAWDTENLLKPNNVATICGDTAIYPDLEKTSILPRINAAFNIPADMPVIAPWAAQNGLPMTSMAIPT